MANRSREYKEKIMSPISFASKSSSLKLRSYQEEVARCIVESVMGNKGMTFVVIFPRQSGKNEIQAHIEAFLLNTYKNDKAEIVKASPTFNPQTLNAIDRLKRVLKENQMIRKIWEKEHGYVFRIGSAKMTFLSGDEQANVVGATANLLLECDEAQSVLIPKWDKDFAPMAASTNATRVFWGTMWTNKTLLAREMRAALEAERQDGQKRVFVIDAEEVAKDVPAYGEFVNGEVAKFGRNHPLIKTQYFSEEIDAEIGMFSAGRRAIMQGSHPPQMRPMEGGIYAILVDVAGEDEAARGESIVTLDYADLHNPARDATALTVVRIGLESLADELIKAPTYHVVHRRLWTGASHTGIYGQVKALAEHWGVRWLVVDATGVGAGLASFLEKALPNRVIPFIFSTKSKSDLGWGFLAAIETGRYKEPLIQIDSVGQKDGLEEAGAGYYHEQKRLQEIFWTQAEYCQAYTQEGPGRILRWGVPDGARHVATGEPVHDDLLISAAMCAVLDGQVWGIAESGMIPPEDPFEGMAYAF